MKSHLLLASFLAASLAAGAARGQTVPAGTAAPKADAAAKPSYGFPAVPSAALGLTQEAKLDPACGGQPLPLDPVSRDQALKNCTKDLNDRAAMEKAASALKEQEHPKADEPPVSADGAPPGAAKTLIDVNNFAGKASGSPSSGSAHAVSAWPQLLGGGCAQVCFGTFLVDGNHMTVEAGQWAGQYHFVRMLGSGPSLAAVLERDGKTKMVKLP